jgi:hypothetical protein
MVGLGVHFKKIGFFVKNLNLTENRIGGGQFAYYQ